MNPLSALFGTAVGLRNSLYDRGILRARRLQGPVVSVGNLSVGGSGKTPFVILLGELLRARGIDFDVLTRGYGRSSRGVVLVDPAGSAREFGDEPLLIARRLRVPVIVGERRFEAGCFAERQFGPRLHLLDDGFQHRRLARDFDIVLLTPKDLDDRLLPAGRLREGLSALRRANAVVLMSAECRIPASLDGKLVWRAKRGIAPHAVPLRPLAFCGIARPKRFFDQLREAGVEPVAEIGFRDHHAYRAEDVIALKRKAQESAAGGFVTTEKDRVNLGPLVQELQPLATVPVTMELVDGPKVVDSLLTAIDQRRRL